MAERANQAGFLLSAAPRLRANKINAWPFATAVFGGTAMYSRKGARREEGLPVAALVAFSWDFSVLSRGRQAQRLAGADIFAPSRLRVNTSIDASPWRLATIVRADLARRCR
jgi:hypothetical protein